jgi:hypothetical protein
MIIGYALVSTDGQTLDAQQSALKAAGAEKVYAEKISGAVTDRRQLGKANRRPCAWRYLVGLSPGSVSEIDQRPPECLGKRIAYRRRERGFGRSLIRCSKCRRL